MLCNTNHQLRNHYRRNVPILDILIIFPVYIHETFTQTRARNYADLTYASISRYIVHFAVYCLWSYESPSKCKPNIIDRTIRVYRAIRVP